MSDVEGFILAGGASSRMGRDKAHLRFDNESFVELAAKSLSAVAARISVVSAKEDAGIWRLPVVRDVYRGCGALGGIHAALAAGRERWAAVISCDLPFATGELLARLVSLREATGGEEFEAVAPLQADGRPQPMCALYRREPCLRRAAELLAAGELRPRVLLRQAHTRWVEPSELSDLKGASLFFVNVNTPEDYSAACKQARESKE
ncbi:MAG TPA: molybdenum cofactor guanylyltransferase [Pyrinomonadaceae bacterium]|jgi:molybdopterin-guanine dinucleotide biosynthesis protein A